jgi:probable HAF family extracellular repeat protein
MKQCPQLAILSASVIWACAGSDAVSPTSLDAKIAFAKPTSSGIVVTQLPSLGGSASAALAINDAGTIVGSSTNAQGVGFAVRWVFQNRSWVPTPLAAGAATAINANGTILGYRGDQILVWENGSEYNVGAGHFDYRAGINLSGTAVGNAAAGGPAAWVRSANTWTEYALPLGTYVSAYPASINDAGVIVGAAHDVNRIQWAVKWTLVDPAVTNVWILSVIEPEAAGNYYALDVNTAGDIVGGGHTGVNGGNMAYLWSNGARTQLGTLGGCCSWANAATDIGEIVGVANGAHGNQYGFYWRAGSMTALNPPARYASVEARDLNAHKQVVGSGSAGRGQTAAFLWTLP